ncbi:MAG: AMMECR1 domain-containing protein [Campylobacterales bacterium]|nr:AMMECR1 domain-containing protein [Campylobacterales bacterium]
MSRSLLLDLARASIEEVLEAQRSIDTEALKREHPVLNTPMATAITLMLGNEVRAHYCSLHATKPLIDDLIYNAKVAAFESPHTPPLSTSEYLHVSVTIHLLGALEPIEADTINAPCSLLMRHGDQEAYIFETSWQERKAAEVLDDLRTLLGLDAKSRVELFHFSLQSATDLPMLRHI